RAGDGPYREGLMVPERLALPVRTSRRARGKVGNVIVLLGAATALLQFLVPQVGAPVWVGALLCLFAQQLILSKRVQRRLTRWFARRDKLEVVGFNEKYLLHPDHSAARLIDGAVRGIGVTPGNDGFVVFAAIDNARKMCVDVFPTAHEA